MKLTSHLAGNVLALLVLIFSSTSVRAELITVNFQRILSSADPAFDSDIVNGLLNEPVVTSLPLPISFSFQGPSSFPRDDLPLVLISTPLIEQLQQLLGTPTTVPEPASWLLLGIGIVIGVFTVKRAFK